MQNRMHGRKSGDGQNFVYWDDYWGLLYEDLDERFPSHVYGFERRSDIDRGESNTFAIPSSYDDSDHPGGAVFGYVLSGRVEFAGERRDLSDGSPKFVPFRGVAHSGQYFSLADGGQLSIQTEHAIVFAVQRLGYLGWNTIGGPIEQRGRLRYIDGCSDSLLLSPIKKGDPCLNHLHFPEGIDQTAHTHPSLRAGIVARALGECRVPQTGSEDLYSMDLKPGRIFVIPRDGLHAFATLKGQSMDVIPYHPDSDFGPENEEHPMVNRTLVDGSKIDNSSGVHTTAKVVSSDL